MKTGAPSNLNFKLGANFFGIDASYKVQLHDQLFELIWAGNGKWDWDLVYNLPLHLKRMWIIKTNKKLTPAETNNEQQAAEDKMRYVKRHTAS